LANSDCVTGDGCDVTTRTCDANLCADGIKDGTETDVDCGGGTCSACAVGKGCSANGDCASGDGCDVTTKTCDANLCNDGIKDGNETDVDCGGGTCVACLVGKKCNTNSDCGVGAGCDFTTKTCDSTQCSDGIKDGAETDVDCGGGTCPACAQGKGCKTDGDCLTGDGCDVATKTCDANLCNDGIKDGNETDVDCGGSTCSGCPVGKACGATSDCLAGEGCDVTFKTCDGNTCSDGAEDGTETDVDCGGPTCAGCAVGKRCNATSDCIVGEGCDVATKHCDPNECNDGVKDGTETDVDCGGATCSGCGVNKKCNVDADCVAPGGCDVTTKTCDANQCHDGAKDGTETDVDCGGALCAACAIGASCNVTSDCLAPEGCDKTTKTCDANECNDGSEDGSETDVDCGGGTCSGCAVNKKCVSTTDCLAGEGCDTTTKRCDPNECNDGTEDGAETDVDCGGPTCSGCAVNKKCVSTTDCLAGEGCDKTTKTCDANECNDGSKDGAETDIDCGGPTCSSCGVGKSCLVNSDCLGGDGCDKTTKTCDANDCNDGIKDGAETDVDCGGGTCAACALGQICVAGTDCASGNCHGGTCAPACVNTTYSAIGGQQNLVLPTTGSYTIEAAGAQGGADSLGDGGQGGLGALARATLALTAGNTLQIVVGSRPVLQFSNDAGSGGGGSFVYLGASAFPLPGAPFVVAGGGGGGTGSDAVVTAGGGGGGAGGTGGNGTGAGGVGWLSVGGNGSSAGGPPGGGQQWSGGAGCDESGNRSSAGGFGGGGGADVFNTGVGGGGGGYTGGHGGNLSSTAAGGGSSFLSPSGTSTTLTAHYQTGNGYVKVTGPLSGTCP
jgi:hypothetical protein